MEVSPILGQVLKEIKFWKNIVIYRIEFVCIHGLIFVLFRFIL